MGVNFHHYYHLLVDMHPNQLVGNLAELNQYYHHQQNIHYWKSIHSPEYKKIYNVVSDRKNRATFNEPISLTHHVKEGTFRPLSSKFEPLLQEKQFPLN